MTRGTLLPLLGLLLHVIELGQTCLDAGKTLTLRYVPLMERVGREDRRTACLLSPFLALRSF